MGVASMFTSKNRLELSLIVSREIKLLLTDQQIGPSTSLMLIKLPALPVIDPREVLLRNGPVDLNHRPLDKRDVVLCAQRGRRPRRRAAQIRCENHAGPCAIHIIRRVADRPDPRDVDRAAAPEDRILLVLPEPGLVVQRDFTGGGVVEGGDRAAEQRRVAGQLPQPDLAEGCGYDGVIILLALGGQLEGVLAPV